MNTLYFYLWKEWREHRRALFAVALTCLVMMTGFAWLFASRRVLQAPLFPMVSGQVAVLIAILAVGGELLSERQTGRLVWLQRLPAGLATPFWAKLVFHTAITIGAGLLGFLLAFPAAWLRGAAPQGFESEALGPFYALAVVALWTFTASSWSPRSVLSFLGATLVLAALGFPIWRVVHAGYHPSTVEVALFSALLPTSALIAAWLGFVHGTRFGREPLASALFGLAPALLVLSVISGWSVARMNEREVFDPLAVDFRTREQVVTEDGRTAFVLGHNVPWRWDGSALPLHALRVDLEHGSFENLGRLAYTSRRYGVEELLPFLEEFVIVVEGRETPLAFGMNSGEPRPWKSKKKESVAWANRKGLGFYVSDDECGERVVRDPFRGRDFSARNLGDVINRGRLLVRPGRWLYAPSAASWLWFDPETNERTPVEWPEHSEPLVLFEDGRILLANTLEGLQLVHPELGRVEALDSQGVAMKNILSNWNLLRVPNPEHGDEHTGGAIVLQTSQHAWLVLDAEATSVRRLPVEDGVRFLHRVGPNEAIVENGNDGDCIARMDLATGELTPLWPPKKSN